MLNRRGLSPIFAVLILIAISIIAGIVMYLYTSGSLSTLAKANAVGSQRVAVYHAEGAYTSVRFYAQSLTGASVEVSAVMVKDAAGHVVASVGVNSNYQPIVIGRQAALTELNIADGQPTSIQLWSGERYSLTIVTESGDTAESQVFTAN